MNQIEHGDLLATFASFPIVVPLGTGARRLILSTYAVRPTVGNCFWLDAQATQGAVLRRLEMSFELTRGVPLTLATRAVRPLGRATTWGEPVWAPPFLRLCTHYGCRPVQGTRDAAWEGAIRDALLRRDYANLEEFEETLGSWNSSCEHTEPGLRPLPVAPFITQHEHFRRAAADGFVLHAGDYYSVPQVYAGQSLWIRPRDTQVWISTPSGDVVATHQAGSGRGEVIMDLAHFTSRQRANRETRMLERAFLGRFPSQQMFLSLLAAQHRKGVADHLKAILRFSNQNSEADMLAAFQKCIRYNNLSHRFLRGLLPGVQEARPAPAAAPLNAIAIQGQLF